MGAGAGWGTGDWLLPPAPAAPTQIARGSRATEDLAATRGRGPSSHAVRALRAALDRRRASEDRARAARDLTRAAAERARATRERNLAAHDRAQAATEREAAAIDELTSVRRRGRA